MHVSLAAVITAVAGLALFSQFGQRISAKHSLIWLLVFTFLCLAALFPEALLPLTHLLGFELVSNLVLSSLLFFSFLEILLQSAHNATTGRSMRQLVSRDAARSFAAARELDFEPTVLVVCPCYNEEAALPETIRQLDALRAEHPEIGYCIVDDGSRDRSTEVLAELAPRNHTAHLTNAGVSTALLSGFLAARSLNVDFVVQCDADGQHPIEAIPRLLALAREQESDLMIGSRYLGDRRGAEALESTTRLRWLGGRLIVSILRLFGSGVGVTDPTSGFRVYSQEMYNLLIDHMPEEYPEPETIAIALQAGRRVAEVPVAMRPRTTGESSITGLKAAQFMLKVSTALLAMWLRGIQLRPRLWTGKRFSRRLRRP